MSILFMIFVVVFSLMTIKLIGLRDVECRSICCSINHSDFKKLHHHLLPVDRFEFEGCILMANNYKC